MSELHRVERRYARDSRLIDLLGGLQVAIARLDALLARYAPAAPAVAANGSTGSAGSCESTESLASRESPELSGSRAGPRSPVLLESSACVDATLGAIAIRDRLASLIQPAALPEPEPPGPARVLESLLR